MKRKNLIILLIACMMVLATACSKKNQTGAITLLNDTFRAELGEEMSEDIEDYAEAEASVLAESILDLSEVDVFNLGTYTGMVIYNDEEFTFTVIVEDTQAPKTALLSDVFYLEVEDYLEIDEILEDVEEEDEYVLTFTYDDTVVEEEGLYFEEVGEYDVVAKLVDNSGNTTTLEFKVIVSDISIPELTGLTDMVVRAGETPDYLKGVTAYSNKHGDLTSQIEVDDSDVDYEENGLYEVYYSVMDEDGNEGEGYRTVKVTGNVEINEDDEEEDLESFPEISGVYDFDVLKNGSLPADLLAGVSAYDDKDGDLTAKIQVHVDDIDFSAVDSQFEIRYTVENSDGNVATEIAVVTIVE